MAATRPSLFMAGLPVLSEPPSLSEALTVVNYSGAKGTFGWVHNVINQLAAGLDEQRVRHGALEEEGKRERRLLAERLSAVESDLKGPLYNRTNSFSMCGSASLSPNFFSPLQNNSAAGQDGLMGAKTTQRPNLLISTSVETPDCDVEASLPTTVRVDPISAEIRGLGDRWRLLEQRMDMFEEQQLHQQASTNETFSMRFEALELEVAIRPQHELDSQREGIKAWKSRIEREVPEAVQKLGKDVRAELMAKAGELGDSLRGACHEINQNRQIRRDDAEEESVFSDEFDEPTATEGSGIIEDDASPSKASSPGGAVDAVDELADVEPVPVRSGGAPRKSSGSVSAKKALASVSNPANSDQPSASTRGKGPAALNALQERVAMLEKLVSSGRGAHVSNDAGERSAIQQQVHLGHPNVQFDTVGPTGMDDLVQAVQRAHEMNENTFGHLQDLAGDVRKLQDERLCELTSELEELRRQIQLSPQDSALSGQLHELECQVEKLSKAMEAASSNSRSPSRQGSRSERTTRSAGGSKPTSSVQSAGGSKPTSSVQSAGGSKPTSSVQAPSQRGSQQGVILQDRPECAEFPAEVAEPEEAEVRATEDLRATAPSPQSSSEFPPERHAESQTQTQLKTLAKEVQVLRESFEQRQATEALATEMQNMFENIQVRETATLRQVSILAEQAAIHAVENLAHQMGLEPTTLSATRDVISTDGISASRLSSGPQVGSPIDVCVPPGGRASVSGVYVQPRHAQADVQLEGRVGSASNVIGRGVPPEIPGVRNPTGERASRQIPDFDGCRVKDDAAGGDGGTGGLSEGIQSASIARFEIRLEELGAQVHALQEAQRELLDDSEVDMAEDIGSSVVPDATNGVTGDSDDPNARASIVRFATGSRASVGGAVTDPAAPQSDATPGVPAQKKAATNSAGNKIQQMSSNLASLQATVNKIISGELNVISPDAIAQLDQKSEARMASVWKELTEYAETAAERADQIERVLVKRIDKVENTFNEYLAKKKSQKELEEQMKELKKTFEWLMWRITWLEWATKGEERGFGRPLDERAAGPCPASTRVATAFAQPITEDVELWARTGSAQRLRRQISIPIVTTPGGVAAPNPPRTLHTEKSVGTRSQPRLPSIG